MNIQIFSLSLLIIFSNHVYSQVQQDILISENGRHPAVSVDDSDEMHLVWSENYLLIKYVSLDSNGVFINNMIVISNSFGPMYPSIEIEATLIATAWETTVMAYNSHIYGQLLTINGNLLDNNVRYDDNYADALRFAPDIAWLNDSIYVVIWTGDGPHTPSSGSGVYGQLATSSNYFIGNNFLASDHGFENVNHGSARIVNIPDFNKFLVVWRDNYLGNDKVWGRYFDYNCIPLNDSFLISDSITSYGVWGIDCGLNNKNNTVIVWGEGDISIGFIKWRWIDHDGNFITDSEIISSANWDVSYSVASGIATDLNGDMIILWEDERNGKSEIYGQRFKQDRTKLGSDFKVSSRVNPDYQIFPDVTLQNRKIYIVWDEVGQVNEGVWASIFNYDIYVSSSRLDFGNVEINTISDTLKLIISNYGENELTITDIPEVVGSFKRTSTHNFPVTLPSLDSLTVDIIFTPVAADDYDEILPILSSDPNFPEIHLEGHSYEMLQAYTDIFYASTGIANNGETLVLKRETGAGTTLGSSLYSEVRSLTVNPFSNIIYGLVSGSLNSEIVRVNAGQGDSYKLFSLDIPYLTGVDFDTAGNLYVSKETGEIYRIDLTNRNYTYVSTATIPLNAIAFDPVTNQLWAAIRRTFGAGKDSVYTIELSTGTATPIGITGFGAMTNDLAFDENNRLYGVTGASYQTGMLFEINKVNGSGTLIGDIGFNHVLGLAFSINGPVNSVGSDELIIANKFSLEQNYPNPFNPYTKIKYSIPLTSFVVLKVYDILGNEIETLVNEEKTSGVYEVVFDAANLSSGIYFYQLQSGDFISTKKLVLIK